MTAPTATQDNMARPTVAQRSRALDTRTVPAALLKLARFEEALADAAECIRHDAASIEARPHRLFGMPARRRCAWSLAGTGSPSVRGA